MEQGTTSGGEVLDMCAPAAGALPANELNPALVRFWVCSEHSLERRRCLIIRFGGFTDRILA